VQHCLVGSEMCIRDRHKGENIKRAKHTLGEKDTFQHLVNVSEVVQKKTRKQLLK
jgi:hypothetical protein